MGVQTTAPEAICPTCGHGTAHVHRHYCRTLADLPWHGVPLRLPLSCRTFYCDRPDCSRRIFTEWLSGIVHPSVRSTERVAQALLLLGYALGGEAGARLVAELRMKASADTLLREMVRSTPFTVQAWSLDDERLTLRLLLNEDHPASLADPLRVELHLVNSEIGLGRVSIHALITRLVCRNGLIVGVADLGGVERRHIGRAEEDLSVLLRVGHTRVLAEAQEAARRFVALRQQPAPRPVAAFLRRTTWEAKRPQSLLPAAVAALEGESVYGVCNALTRVAQRLPVAERLQVETAVSRYLQRPAPRT